jgi:hypothetical protein
VKSIIYKSKQCGADQHYVAKPHDIAPNLKINYSHIQKQNAIEMCMGLQRLMLITLHDRSAVSFFCDIFIVLKISFSPNVGSCKRFHSRNCICAVGKI